MNLKVPSLRQAVTIVAAVITIVINILSNAIPFNGQNTGDISDRFLVYFVPAGYVFSIWGLIYLGWIAYCIYQVQPAQRQNPRLNAIAPLFWLSAFANSIWLFLWHWNYFGLTLVAMLLLLGSLIAIYLRLRASGDAVPNAERWAVRLPFSIYLGWVSVATIANVTDVLYWLKWDGWGIAPTVWAAVMLAVASIVGLLMQLRERDTGFLAVLLWAFVGIALKHAAAPIVPLAAWLAVAFVGVVAASRFFLRPQTR